MPVGSRSNQRLRQPLYDCKFFSTPVVKQVAQTAPAVRDPLPDFFSNTCHTGGDDKICTLENFPRPRIFLLRLRNHPAPATPNTFRWRRDGNGLCLCGFHCLYAGNSM